MVELSNNIISKHLRPVLWDLYAKCTEGQQGKFIRIFGSVADMPAEKIPDAMALCERTIKNNIEQSLKEVNDECK